jgi:hypothetical protein
VCFVGIINVTSWMHGMWIILTNRSCWVTSQQWWNFFCISIFYVQFSRKLYTPKDDEEDVYQEGTVIFSAEKDNELQRGVSANVRGKSSNRYVGSMMFLLPSASLYTVISHPLQGWEKVIIMCLSKLHCANFLWEK